MVVEVFVIVSFDLSVAIEYDAFWWVWFDELGLFSSCSGKWIYYCL